MAGRWRHDNPFEEGEIEVNPFSHQRPTPLPPEPVTFYNDIGASVDIPLDTKKDLKKKERELLAKEAELNKREQELKRREEALARAGVFIEPKNWPPFFPIIHVDISNDIPVHLQRVQVGHMPLLEHYMRNCCLDFRGKSQGLVSGRHILHHRMPRCLLFMVPASLSCHEERECFQIWMVLPVLFFSHFFLHLRGYFSGNSVCWKIIDWNFSSHQRNWLQCYSWDILLPGLRDVCP